MSEGEQACWSFLIGLFVILVLLDWWLRGLIWIISRMQKPSQLVPPREGEDIEINLDAK